MPDHIPKVEEIGATSAPLLSASYFIGDRCRAFNDDYMKCKAEAGGRGEVECLREGRKVTRCAASVYVPFSNVGEITAWERRILGSFCRILTCLIQNKRHQHPLHAAVQGTLGVSGAEQPPVVELPKE